MGLILRKFLMSILMAMVLLPVVVSASTEFKGTATVNINKANAATLAAYLKGVGANKAEAIVKYRKSNGKFKSIDDLKNVPGIGDETYKDVKKNVSTSRGKSVAPDGYKMAESSGKSTSSKKKRASSKSTAKKTTSKSSSKSDSKSKAKKTSKAKKSSTAKKTADSKKKSTAKKTAKKSTSSKKTKAKKSAKSKSTKKKATKKKSTKKKSTKKKSS